MGVMSRMMKSVFLSVSSSCRRMSTCSSSPSSLFLVSRFSHETDYRYFSLISSENGAKVRDFHSPHFGCTEVSLSKWHGYSPCFTDGPQVSLSRCEGLVRLYHAPNEERLWNPWTNEFKLIPPSYVPRPPNKSDYIFSHEAFGFDPKSGDYKIIRLVHNSYDEVNTDNARHGGVLQFELYSLRDDSWKEIDILYDDPYLDYFIQDISYFHVKSLWKEIFEDPTHPYHTSDGVANSCYSCYANGCCYWRTNKGNILSFDFATEIFTSFSLPKTGMFEFVPRFDCERIDGLKYSLELLEFNGLLGAIVYTKKKHSSPRSPDMSSVFDGELWVWSNESWSRKFEIHFVGPRISRIFGFCSDNRFQLFLLGGSALGLDQLWTYDVDTQQLKKFDIYHCNNDLDVFPYFDTKVHLNRIIN